MATIISQAFITTTRAYTQNETLDGQGATDIEFYNAGTNNVEVNNRPILPNQWWQINGFPGEINTSKYSAIFIGATTGLLIVTRRIYTDQVVKKPA